MSNQLGIDRISDLPDPIICHILSFLPTKHAVGTGVLSKRWKYLWASVPTLDLDDWLLFNPQTDRGKKEPFGEISFMNFVDRVLIFRDVLCLEKLGLICRGAYDTYRINSWIRVAIRRGVEELDLGLYLPRPIVFPMSLFTCKTLVKFNLRCFTVLDVPQTVCFSSLKILYLHLVEFVDMDSTKRLFDGCPVLEELVLQNCRREKVAFFYICSPTLKRLTVDLSLFGTEDSKKHIVVNAPVLDCLTINNFTSDYLSTNLYSLIRGSIPLREIFPTSLEVGPGFVHGISRLLQSTSYIKFLSLSSNLMKLLNSGAYTSLPTFYNLNQMELSADAINWNLLLALLLRVPNLQVLVFNKGFVDLENHEEPFLWSPDYYVPHCLMFHLKEIKVRKFGGTKEELIMVKYFLEEARVLSEMTINCGGSFKHKAKICKKLKKVKQGSPTCKVNVIL